MTNVNEINFTQITKEQFISNPVTCYRRSMNYHNVYSNLLDKFKEMNEKTSKEEYLEWVKEWKQAYKDLSKASRMYKLLRKDIHSNKDTKVKYRATYNVWLLKGQARWLLDLRQDAKEIARAAYAYSIKNKELEAA